MMNREVLVGIHQDPYGEFGDYIQRFEDICKLNSIPSIRMNASDLDFWERLEQVTHFIYRWGHNDAYRDLATTILPLIENKPGIRCYPNQASCWHYDDKIKQYYLLKHFGYPTVPSYVFWDRTSAMKWLATAQYPLVFKLTGGAGSGAVILVRNYSHAVKLTKMMFGRGVLVNRIPDPGTTRKMYGGLVKRIRKKAASIRNYYLGKDLSPCWKIHKNYAYFQDFMPGNEWDTRVATIGNRADAFRRFVRKGDFRASGGHLWDTDKSKIDMRFIRMALDISGKLGFQSMAYDFIYDQNGNPRIIEISYTYGEPDTPDFNEGYWDTDLVWHSGNYRTRELIMADLLEMSNLKYPIIKA